MTRQRFGKVIRLFAPLYLSNECVNNCKYCGFSRDNPILRVTLCRYEVRLNARRTLKEQGFRNILLVAASIRNSFPTVICAIASPCCIRLAGHFARSRADGDGGLSSARPAGADGLVVYQETYDRKVYADMHTAGPEAEF